MSSDTFLLAEAPYVSIQCEGKTLNKFSLFIRFFGCNYTCSFCDSKFTWARDEDGNTPSGQQGISYNIASLRNLFIRDHLKSVTSQVVKNIVFTGGEPLIHQKQIASFINEIPYDDASYEFETNGVIELTKDFLFTLAKVPNKSRNILFNISPKTQFFNEYPGDKKILQDNIKYLHVLGLPYILKFVDEVHNREQILDFVKSVRNYVCSSQIYVMPECTTREEHIAKFEKTLEFCETNGYNFSPRLHILLWDNKKGV